MKQWCRVLVYLLLAWTVGACPALANSRMRICGPPVAESLVFAVMAQKGLAPVAFIPWSSPDQARAMIAGKRVDAAIVTTSAAAAFLAKGVDVRIAGVFDSPLWVVSSRDRAKVLPLDGVLLFPFGHREMPELLFNIVFGRSCPDLETRHTGGAMEAVNFMLLGRAHHALLAEPAATLAVLRSEKAGDPGLVKHLDIRKVWKDKFRGMPLYVSALAVFGPSLGSREEIRAVIRSYAVARQWVAAHPHKALALAGEAAPSLAAQMPDAGRFKPAGQLSDSPADFDAAFFFLNRIHDRFPGAVGDALPVRTLFMGEKMMGRFGGSSRGYRQGGRRVMVGAAGVFLLAGLWQWAAWAFSGLVVAAPLDTLSAVLALVSDSDFIFSHFLVTLGRMALALGIGIGVGGILGIAAGLAPGIRALVEPLRWMLMTVPGVVIVVVFMLWFGMGTAMVVAIAASMGAPVIFVHVADAMALADENLLEMARVYRFGFRDRLIRIYAMAVAGPFFSALVVAAGNTIRVVVLAEVLGANQGLGHCLAMARTRLDTPALYALALISMSMVGGMEFFVLRPLEKRLVWKG